MRRRRCDFGVGPGGGQPAVGKFRVVTGMNQVVRKSRVLWIGAIERFEQIDRLLLFGMRLVRGRGVGKKSQSIKYLAFDILTVVGGEIGHSFFVARGALLVGDRSSIFEYE